MADGFGSCSVAEGCQSGCDGGGTPTTLVTSSSSSQEPVLGKPTVAPSTGVETTDGTCGAINDNTVCGNWPQGSCCSLYGVSTLITEKLGGRVLTRLSSAAKPLLIAVMGVRAGPAQEALSLQPLVLHQLPLLQPRVRSKLLVKQVFRLCMLGFCRTGGSCSSIKWKTIRK